MIAKSDLGGSAGCSPRALGPAGRQKHAHAARRALGGGVLDDDVRTAIAVQIIGRYAARVRGGVGEGREVRAEIVGLRGSRTLGGLGRHALPAGGRGLVDLGAEGLAIGGDYLGDDPSSTSWPFRSRRASIRIGWS
jgi:hypothetical protein